MGEFAEMEIGNRFFYTDKSDLVSPKPKEKEMGEMADWTMEQGEDVYIPRGTFRPRRSARRMEHFTEGDNCPKCGGFMVKRENSRTGNSFAGCSNFPNCKHSGYWVEPEKEEEPVSEQIQTRVISYKGSIYVHSDDVAKYLQEVAGGEETDVRNRLEQAARAFKTAAQKFGG